MSFVLDASIALAWCFHDEATPATTKLLEKLETTVAFVPALWSLEVGNVLVMAERRKRITYAGITQFLSMLANLNIHVDEEMAKNGFQEILPLAYSEKLTTYDAAYLELAMRRGEPLASKDTQLCKAAARLGVKIISV
jgi:predicted nucleic acid-binding protein